MKGNKKNSARRFPLRLLASGACAALILSVTAIGHATIRYVPDAYETVQQALDSSLAGDTVLIRRGIYWEMLSVPGYNVTVSSEFLFSRDWDDVLHTIIIPPDELNDVRVLNAVDTGTRRALNIVGLTLRGGVANPSRIRGGLYVSNRHLTMDHCVVDSCYALFGGALSITASIGEFSDCVFRHTGAYLDGYAFLLWPATLALHRCTFSHSFSHHDYQRGVFSLRSGQLKMNDCVLHDIGWDKNIGDYIFDVTRPTESVEITNCEIHNNRVFVFLRDTTALPFVRFDSNYVHHNQVFQDFFRTDHADTGIYFSIRSNVFIDNSNIPNPYVGGRMFFTFAGSYYRADVIGNLFFRNHNRENSVGCIGENSHSQFTVRRNYILDNSHNAVANPPGGVLMLVANEPQDVQYNIIAGNRGFAAFNGLRSYPPGHALHNWWNDPTGPYDSVANRGGRGDTVEWHINYRPWEADTSFMDTTAAAREPYVPTDYVIGYAWPNPFNAAVTIEFAVTRTLPLRLEIYDVLGRYVATVLDEPRGLGVHRVTWPAAGCASGIYFARLSSPQSPLAPALYKLVLLK